MRARCPGSPARRLRGCEHRVISPHRAALLPGSRNWCFGMRLRSCALAACYWKHRLTPSGMSQGINVFSRSWLRSLSCIAPPGPTQGQRQASAARFNACGPMPRGHIQLAQRAVSDTITVKAPRCPRAQRHLPAGRQVWEIPVECPAISMCVGTVRESLRKMSGKRSRHNLMR